MKSMLLIALMLICLFSPSAFGLDPMGPPAATLKQGQFRAGAEYSYSQMDIEANNPDFRLFGISTPGIIGSGTIEDLKSNKFYTNLGFGLVDQWEVFIRLGAGDVRPDKSNNSANVAGYIGNSDYGFALGGGTKMTFWESEDGKLALGALAQIGWTSVDFNEIDTVVGYSVATEIDLLEVQIAFGPTFRPIEGVSFYGGPFFHIVSGEADLDGTILGVPATLSVDLEQESIFGGYVGAQVDIGEHLSLHVEGQFTGDASAVATGVALKF